MTAVAVIAKECLPGRVKTRLAPPFTLEQAARIAAASLDDTLATVAALPADRRILFFDGEVPPALAAGFEVLTQPEGTLDERLAALFDAVDEPLLLVGMDTPQLSAAHVAAFFEQHATAPSTAWFGPAADGGFWGLGVGARATGAPRGELLRGVPMSRDDTGAIQRDRLRAAGLDVVALPELVDIDTVTELRAVAQQIPTSRLGAALRIVDEEAST